MASKAELINYIVENFEGPEGIPASKPKLENFKKAELEEFVEKKSSIKELESWLASH